MKRVVLIFALLATTTLAFAQPPEVIGIGESHCIQVVPGNLYSIVLEGNVSGPGGVPVLIMEAGCLTEHCNVTCTPIDPPDELVFGADPSFPNDWFGESECLTVYMHWVHDAVWTYEVFSTCTGCFCLTFDMQLAANLISFTAMPGDASVELRWMTASESGSDRFEVHRDGVEIARMNAIYGAAGGSYAWRDLRLTNGRTYRYTLYAVDENGVREPLASLEAVPSFGAAQVREYALHQNFPNPFNASTSITFDLVEPGPARVLVYNMIGNLIAVPVSQILEAGRHVVSFDAGELPSGMYIYRLETGDFAVQRKMVVLK